MKSGRGESWMLALVKMYTVSMFEKEDSEEVIH